MFRFSPSDYQRIGEVWNGPHPEDGSELRVEDTIPEGAPPPDLDAEPQLTGAGRRHGDGPVDRQAAAGLSRPNRRGAANRPRPALTIGTPG